MRDHDRKVILFGGEAVHGGYRGRTSRPINAQPGRWVIGAFLALLLGFSSAATAITLRHKAAVAQTDQLHYSLPGNFRGYGIEEALY
jgi:hypothetical protein